MQLFGRPTSSFLHFCLLSGLLRQKEEALKANGRNFYNHNRYAGIPKASSIKTNHKLAS